MRPMDESTYNAIKAKNLIGAKAPSSFVQIDGYKDIYSEPEPWSINAIAGTIGPSGYTGTYTVDCDYCARVDGKVLMAYYSSGVLKLSYCNSENDIITTDNLGPINEWNFLTAGSNPINGFKLIKLRNNKILLMVGRTGVTGTVPNTVDAYISNNGLGNDFIPYSVAFSFIRPVNNGVERFGVGKPIQLSNGRIILIANVGVAYSNYTWSCTRCLYSDDDGLTWSVAMLYNPLTSYLNEKAGSIAVFENAGSRQLVTALSTMTGTGYEWYHVSYDDGTTWNKIPDRTGYLFLAEGIFSSMAGGGSDPYVYYLTNRVVGNTYTNLYLFRRPTNQPLPSSAPSIYDMSLWEGPIFPNPAGDDMLERVFVSDFGSIVASGPTSWGSAYIASVYIATRNISPAEFPIVSATINKNKGSANTASIRAKNFGGFLNPRNTNSPLYGILSLNRRFKINQGYGDDVVTSFTGIIDSIKMSTMPQMADIGLRDYLKIALDQMVTKDGNNTVLYTKQPIETIVADLCSCAGISVGVIETTGISIEKTFAYQSYADAFQFLSDLASFEFLADEDGLFHFRRDYQPNNMFVAWSFTQGVDIQNLSYELNDQDIYYKVKVYGRDGDTVLVYEAPFLDAPEFNILPQKVLKVDATAASTLDELKKIAQRAIATMRSRTRIIEFSTIGIPHLQIGDFIQLFEDSTMSADVYRLTGITLNWSDQGFTMTCKAFYYGDSVVPIELPTETATQTGNPTLNLIPEMTSNITPSGVCRASSVYVLYQNDYKPWNAFNSSSADLFWDASVNHGWIEYEFPENIIIDKYMVKARQLLEYNDAMPKAWTFEAFDGEKWIVLDTRTAQTAWQIHEMREYTFTNTTAYPKYRLNITVNNGYARLQLEQLAMYYRGGL